MCQTTVFVMTLLKPRTTQQLYFTKFLCIWALKVVITSQTLLDKYSGSRIPVPISSAVLKLGLAFMTLLTSFCFEFFKGIICRFKVMAIFTI